MGPRAASSFSHRFSSYFAGRSYAEFSADAPPQVLDENPWISWRIFSQVFDENLQPKFSERIFSGSFGQESFGQFSARIQRQVFKGNSITPFLGPSCGSPPVGVVGCIIRLTFLHPQRRR